MHRVLTAALLIAISGPALAQDLDPVPGGATETALAGAGVLATADASTLWTNPAGLADAGNAATVSLGLQSADRSVLRSSPDALSETRDLAGVALAPAIALSLRLGPVFVGLGYRTGLLSNSVYGEVINEQTNRREDPGYIGAETVLRQHLISAGAGLRWRWMTFGAAVQLSHLRLRQQRVLWAGLQGDALQDASWDLDATLDLHDRISVIGRFGFRIRPISWLRIGFVLATPTDTRLTGTMALRKATTSHKPPSGYTQLQLEDGSADLSITLPLHFAGGIALLFPRLQAHLEVKHTRWPGTELTAELDGPALLLTDVNDKSEKRKLQRLPLGVSNGHHNSFHLGLVLPLLRGFLTARAGYAFHLGATPSRQPSATLMNLRRHVFGIGLEARRGILRLALALEHSFRATLEASGEDAVLLNPLAQKVTESVGEGRFSSSLTRAVVEVGFQW